MTNSRFMLITTFCALLTALLGLHPSLAPGAETIDNAKNQLLQQQKKAHRLQQGIKEHSQRISQTKKEEKNLLSELDGIDKRLGDESKQLQGLNSLLFEQEQALRNTENEFAQVAENKAQRQGPVQERLAAYYRVGDIGIMNLLFSASSLPELLKFKEYFHRVVQHDQEIIDGYRQTLSKLNQAHTDLQHQKEQLIQTIASITGQQQKLAYTRAERITLLNRVKTEKKLYSRAVQEMQGAAKDLAATIKKLQKATAPKPTPPAKKYPHLQSPKKRKPQASPSPTLHGFAASKGYLPPPVEGTVTTNFGRNITAKFGITTYQNGIDISTKPGAEVLAVHDGIVAFAGILRGYGNMIIIDHGDQYYSLSSRIAKLRSEEGVKVSKGQTIGIMGATEGLLAEGLHFEIRHGTKAQDPLIWLDANKLKHKNPTATP
ncbi:murein hydrolase activator EnvC family protein [Thermodesulfobacteriota bacterium]